jgi:hypothetical protein
MFIICTRLYFNVNSQLSIKHEENILLVALFIENVIIFYLRLFEIRYRVCFDFSAYILRRSQVQMMDMSVCVCWRR